MAANRTMSRRLGLVVTILTALFDCCFADEFTNPSNSVADLTIKYTIGQTVQVSWDSSLSEITLLVSHWGDDDVGSLLSDARNPGVYTWIVGQNDNVDEAAIEESSNFVLVITDPSGRAGTGNGFVDNRLSSRAFIIKSNVTASSSSTSSSSTTSSYLTSSSSSTTSSYPTSSSSSTTSTTSSSPLETTGTSDPSPVLSTGAKVGIGVGAAGGAIALMAMGVFLGIRYVRRVKKSKATDSPIAGGRDGVDAPMTQTAKTMLYQHDSAHNDYPYPTSTELPSNSVRLGSSKVHEMGPGY